MGSLLALALVCSTAAPDTTAASDGGIVLTTHVLSSVAFDLDGDGSKEIVAIVTDTDERATLRVQAWGVRGGDWVTFGQDVVETWNAIEGASLTAHLSEETAVLLVLGDGDAQRLIAAVGRPYTDGETPGSSRPITT